MSGAAHKWYIGNPPAECKQPTILAFSASSSGLPARSRESGRCSASVQLDTGNEVRHHSSTQHTQGMRPLTGLQETSGDRFYTMASSVHRQIKEPCPRWPDRAMCSVTGFPRRTGRHAWPTHANNPPSQQLHVLLPETQPPQAIAHAQPSPCKQAGGCEQTNCCTQHTPSHIQDLRNVADQPLYQLTTLHVSTHAWSPLLQPICPTTPPKT
jgi:hypothetical protein